MNKNNLNKTKEPSKELVIKPRKLTLKQQRFIQYYLETGNGAEAVRKAGYNLGKLNGSKTHLQALEVASSIAEENLRKPDISNIIATEILKLKLKPENVLNRIDKIADTANKPSDQLKALELLGKHIALFGETTDTNLTQINIVLGNKPDNTIVSTQ
jgi:phage terminase small subunit